MLLKESEGFKVSVSEGLKESEVLNESVGFKKSEGFKESVGEALLDPLLCCS